MIALGRILGYLSILTNLLLGLFLLGLGLLGAMEGADMEIDVIPASPESMSTVLILSGLFAIAAVVLALRNGRGARSLLVLWSLLVTSILICAFTRSSYSFDGIEHFRTGVWVFLGSLLLLFGSYKRWKITPAHRN